jgi:hypothetical protein
MKLKLTLALLLVFFFAAPAFGQITIDLGDHELRPNEAGQFIPILLSTDNSDSVLEANIFLQITGADPRPQFNIISEFDISPRPTLPDPDITSGAIFEGPGFIFDGVIDFKDEIDSPTFTESERRHLAFFSVLGTTARIADGTLALLEVDTTGVFEGQFNIIDIADASNFKDGGLDDIAKNNVAAGSITIVAVPEPSSAIAVAGVGLAMLARRRRRK